MKPIATTTWIIRMACAVLIALSASACQAVAPLFAPQAQPGGSVSNSLVASGFVEADEVAVASELGGRIVALPVAEGAEVSAGALLAVMDRGMAEAELRVAEAGLQSAQAVLARLKAGARAEEIAQAEAAVALAEAGQKAADQALQDARLLLAQQQPLDLQIIQAGTQVEMSRQQLNAAAAALGEAQINQDRFNQPDKDYRTWQSWIGVNASGAAFDGSQAALAQLLAQRRASTAQMAQVNAAQASYQAAGAVVSQAKARLADLRAGPTAEQIGVAEAQVNIAKAGVQTAQARLKKLSLLAPSAGQVIAHNLKVGELAAPGATVLTLANLDSLSLIVYVPASSLGIVQLNAQVPVQVDGFPDREFSAEVIHIAEQAEFVPTNVQTDEDRASLVFAVKLRLANADHALQPGMPADARFPIPEPLAK